MAHAGWSTSLTADGVDLTRTDGTILLRCTRGLNEVPEVRGVDTIIPSLNGRVPRNRRLDVLKIEAAGYVMGTGSDETAQRSSFRTVMEVLRDLMNPVQDPYEIAVVDEVGNTHTITARPLNMVVGDDDIPTFREVSLQWESVDAGDWGVSGS